MKIEQAVFDEFIKQSKYKIYKKMCQSMLLGGKGFSLNTQQGYDESGWLAYNIKTSVQAYTSDKDMAIAMYKDFVTFLNQKGYQINITFPPIAVNSSFERQMFIAKYLQDEQHSMYDLPDLLWVGEKTLRDDFKRLSGENPIQVCGKKFCIPNMEKSKGKVEFASTMHPIFLSENLTQIIVMLKGLKAMSENPLYEVYAKESAKEIWNQLSDYAKRRIRVVLNDILPDELAWYESLEDSREVSFYSEEMCSRVNNRVNNRGLSVLLDCIKNGKTFVVEYQEDKVTCYKDCQMIKGGYHDASIEVECNTGRKILEFERVLRSAYSLEELLAD